MDEKQRTIREAVQLVSEILGRDVQREMAAGVDVRGFVQQAVTELSRRMQDVDVTRLELVDVEITKAANMTLMSHLSVDEQGLDAFMESLTAQYNRATDLHQRLVAIEKPYDELVPRCRTSRHTSSHSADPCRDPLG